jgi:hypothetical protein
MPEVIYTETHDEIVDLVDRVRGAPQPDVALVLNPGTTGFQTPLNVRLLRQLGSRAGKNVSVISGDPHIQELSRVGGLPTYASVPAFERGIQTVRPHSDAGAAPAAAGLGSGLAFPTGPPDPPSRPPTRAAAVGAGAGAAAAAAAAARAPATGRRKPLYFIAIAAAAVGLLLFFVVAPSAKVTVTLAGTPLTVSPTIQGSPDPANAGQADHIVTSVITSSQATQFTATPSGTRAVPATAAKATLVFTTTVPVGVNFEVPRGTEFDTQDSPPIRFFATANTPVCIGPNPSSPPAACTAAENSVPVADATPEAKGNVAANTITKWPSDPCDPSNPPQNAPLCSGGTISETNPAPASGGADATTQVVASRNDVNSWNSQVTQSEQTLTAQATQDMQTKAAGKIIAKDPGGNGSSVQCGVTPALPAANAPFAAAQETVACAGHAAAYTPADVTNAVRADLQAQVAQGDTLAANSINCTSPSVTQAATDGTVVLSIQCTSFSKPGVDLNAIKGQLTGKSPGEAKNVIEHQLNHVQSVAISQSPMPLFWMPFFSSRIEIDETFVTRAGP